MATGFRDILGSLESAAPSVGMGIGSAWGPPGMAIGAGIGGGLSALSKLGTGIYDWATGYEEPLTEEEIAQQNLLQRYRDRLGQGMEGITQEARRGFNQETIPEIMERIGGVGGRTSALGLQLAGASQGLEGRLAQLRENIERGRLGDLSQHLTGQQSVGLQLQNLGQRQREQARSSIGQGMQYGNQVSQGDLARLQAQINAQQQQSNITLGRQAYPVTQETSNQVNSMMGPLRRLLNQ